MLKDQNQRLKKTGEKTCQLRGLHGGMWVEQKMLIQGQTQEDANAHFWKEAPSLYLGHSPEHCLQSLQVLGVSVPKTHFPRIG